MSNTWGEAWRVTTFGESHGSGMGAVIDGCPARMPLEEADIQPQLDRRRPGQSDLTSPRNEADRVEILSGVARGQTLGSPIALLIRNRDQRPEEYGAVADAPRPGHADYTYQCKYGIQAPSGGGRASARETVSRVAAAAVAEKWLRVEYGVEVVAWVSSVGEQDAPLPDLEALTRAQVDRHPVRCPDAAAAERMAAAIRSAKAEEDSVGGIVTCVCRGVPAGWGEPVFGKATARLAQAMLSIPAAKGFDNGSGFEGARWRGSQNNDLFEAGSDGVLATRSNHAGGLQGGITNGRPLLFRVAFKPTATIGRAQESVDYAGRSVVVAPKGRHDPCVLPRAVPVVESMAALVLADLALLSRLSS